MANKIYADIQTMSQNVAFLELFIVDLTKLGGPTLYFTNNIYPNGNSVIWQGNTYTPVPMKMAGWEVMSTAQSGTAVGGGPQPRPNISISNASKFPLPYVVTYGDLIGGTVTRMQTFEKYLDGQPSADPTEFLGPHIFMISQKQSHTKQQITWALSTPLDSPNNQLPARQFLKDGTYLNPAGFPGIHAY